MKWSDIDFVRHFYFEKGAAKNLADIGLLSEVKAESGKLAIDRSGGFKDQIRSEVQRIKEGDLEKNFKNSYSFSSVRFSMGSGVLNGKFEGKCSLVLADKSYFSGKITVSYSDRFEDPLSVIEQLYGSSSSPNAPEWVRNLGNVGGAPYNITGQWTEDFSGDVILSNS